MCALTFHRDRARQRDSRVNSAPKGPNRTVPGAIPHSIAYPRALELVPVYDETDRPPREYS